MNKYYIVFETKGVDFFKNKTHAEAIKTIYDMNTYKGLMNTIKDLQEKHDTPLILISWKHLK